VAAQSYRKRQYGGQEEQVNGLKETIFTQYVVNVYFAGFCGFNFMFD
jgi:hypothetical protein